MGVEPLLWILGALAVGAVALTIVVRVQDRSGHVPPSSMFAAAGIVLSLIAMLAVTAATYRVGVPLRAAIAFGEIGRAHV